MIGKGFLIGATVAAAFVAGIASEGGGGGGSSSSPKARPGSPVVYAAIAAETDCDELQATFDRGSETQKRSGYVPNGPAFEGAQGARWSQVGLGYMEAADARMRSIGCY